MDNKEVLQSEIVRLKAEVYDLLAYSQDAQRAINERNQKISDLQNKLQVQPETQVNPVKEEPAKDDKAEK